MPFTDPAKLAASLPPCDLTRRHVKVLRQRENGYVEFEFSIGWPDLSVELVLQKQDLIVFCHEHGIEPPELGQMG